MTMFISAGYLDRFELADDGNPNLAREPHLLGDLAGDLARQRDGAQIVDPVLLHVNPNLAAALHREGLGHAAEAARDALQIFDAGQVVLVGLAPGALSGGRPGVARRD